MKKILVIGIGAGNPEHMTIQAVNALHQVDVFFLMDKGPAKSKLNALRKEICERFIRGRNYRYVDATNPERIQDSRDYLSSVRDLNREKGEVFARLIRDDMIEGECGAFLVWGDPSLYDSTIRILQTLVESGGFDLEFDVIPGISSIQALAAAHKTTLTGIGGSVRITTGRRFANDGSANGETVVVMLDAVNAYQRVADQDNSIYWGAYVGTPDEILVSGTLRDVAEVIERRRTAARQANGWIMDSYIMRYRTENDD